tara:strand:- start:17164 stop:19122 length:1959 start_codon:yes stop_codon:yes gene_type:complete
MHLIPISNHQYIDCLSFTHANGVAGTYLVFEGIDFSVLLYQRCVEAPNTWICVARLRGHTHHIHAVAISSNGDVLVSVSADKTAKIWDVRTQSQRGTDCQHEGEVLSVAIAPDNQYFATGSSTGEAYAWALLTSQLIRRIPGPQCRVLFIGITEDNKAIVKSAGYGCWHIIPISENKGRIVELSEKAFNYAVLMPTIDKIWVVVSDQHMKVYCCSLVDSVIVPLDLPPGETIRAAVAVPGSQQYFSCSSTGALREWTTQSNTSQWQAQLPGGQRVSAMWLTGNHDLLLNQVGSTALMLCNRTQGYQIRIGCLASVKVQASLMTAHGYLLNMSEEKGLQIFHSLMGEGDSLYEMGQANASAYEMAIFPDGYHVALASNLRGCLMVNTLDGTHTEIARTTAKVSTVSVSPDGLWIALGLVDGQIAVKQLESGSLYYHSIHPHKVYKIIIFKDNKTAISGDMDGQIDYWNITTGEVLGRWETKSDYFDLMVHPSQQNLIFSIAEDSICIDCWDINTSKVLIRLDRKAFKEHISSMMIMPDGHRIVTAGSNGVICLWDLHSTGEFDGDIKVIKPYEYIPVSYLDARLALMPGSSNMLYIWSLDGVLAYLDLNHFQSVTTMPQLLRGRELGLSARVKTQAGLMFRRHAPKPTSIVFT